MFLCSCIVSLDKPFCFCQVVKYFHVFVSFSMPNGGKAPAWPSSSSSSDSEYETIEVEPEPKAVAKAGLPEMPGATSKRKPTDTPSSSTESELEVLEKPGPARPASRTERPAPRRERPVSPERPPSTIFKGGKGSKGKGKITCPHCWARISRTSESSMDQHQHWNSVCLAWQVFSQGNFSWPAAQNEAERIKRFRELTPPDQMEHAIAAGPAALAGSKGGDRGPVVADGAAKPARTSRRKEDTPKRNKENVDHARKERKGRKTKSEAVHKKKKKVKRVSPSPEVARPKGPRKRPPSDDSSEGHRNKQPKVIAQEGRHLVIRLPRSHWLVVFMVHGKGWQGKVGWGPSSVSICAVNGFWAAEFVGFCATCAFQEFLTRAQASITNGNICFHSFFPADTFPVLFAHVIILYSFDGRLQQNVWSDAEKCEAKKRLGSGENPVVHDPQLFSCSCSQAKSIDAWKELCFLRLQIPRWLCWVHGCLNQMPKGGGKHSLKVSLSMVPVPRESEALGTMSSRMGEPTSISCVRVKDGRALEIAGAWWCCVSVASLYIPSSYLYIYESFMGIQLRAYIHTIIRCVRKLAPVSTSTAETENRIYIWKFEDLETLAHIRWAKWAHGIILSARQAVAEAASSVAVSQSGAGANSCEPLLLWNSLQMVLHLYRYISKLKLCCNYFVYSFCLLGICVYIYTTQHARESKKNGELILERNFLINNSTDHMMKKVYQWKNFQSRYIIVSCMGPRQSI